ncbi:Holliday junction resolvase RuvX [Arhodomonas sp. SL1]|uniref:Holliday junction resolvase RuvX n=1 Tax=Arhodomonas sp. SL1 TaxID=3425691 RepID=UPI003F884E96
MNGTLLGFDYGLARIGVAVGEGVTGSARPLRTLAAEGGSPAWGEVATLIEQWQPQALVVGVPRRADGSDGEITAGAERFARRLAGRFRRPVYTVDETLSSREAAARLAADGRAVRGRDEKARLDAAAAAVILETWLAEGKGA